MTSAKRRTGEPSRARFASPINGRRAALYLRVSTGSQTTDNQRLELVAVAERCGWTIVAVYEDAGVSGAKGRDKRPQFDGLCRDAARRRFDVVMAWSVVREIDRRRGSRARVPALRLFCVSYFQQAVTGRGDIERALDEAIGPGATTDDDAESIP